MKTTNTLALIAALAMTLQASSAFASHEDDARIEAAAKKTYVYRTHLKDADIKIKSKDGVVTLTGDVPTQAEKSLAQDTVEGLPGVHRVDNQIKVKPEGERSDDWIAFKVKSTLAFHRSVSATKTKVAVANGVVTLTGNTDSQAEKDLAGEYAGDIEGVKSVKNQLTVTSEPPARTLGEKIDDASITAQVKGALLSHRSTSALKTKVTTKNGVVTVSGDAANQAEKDLVTKLVNDIHGVTSVENDMTVKK
jgi:hyperosmotically inducible periplasmic protein